MKNVAFVYILVYNVWDFCVNNIRRSFMSNITNVDVNYKNPKKYKTAKYPIRQPIYLTWLIWVLSFFATIFKKHNVERINMEGLKAPYMILSNHMSFVDFELVALGTYPQRINNVVNIDGYYQRPWLMEWIGAICTRKFTTDFHLVKSIRKVFSRGDVLGMYPEARYSPCGITSYIPDSVGMLVKRNKVPVVAVLHRGNYLHSPAWDFRRKRKVPLHTTLTQILTVEDIERMSVEEINAKIREALTYDDYKYQKENGILITEPFRAEGMHKILYQCPHCKAEHKMDSMGAELFCTECGKRWTLLEDGNLRANEGETEFTHVPDWFEWERVNVIHEVEEGRYSFSDTADVFSMPRCWSFEKLGKATLTHDPEDGFVIRGHYNGKDYVMEVVVNEAGIPTSKGVAVGDPVSKVTEAYGNNYKAVGVYYSYDAGNKKSLQFLIENDTVTEIDYFYTV